MLALRAHVLASATRGSGAMSSCVSSRCSRGTFFPWCRSRVRSAPRVIWPLAHLALPVIGEGEVRLKGEKLPAVEALRRCGLEPLVLEAKEGLALINGTQAMTAIGVLAALRAGRLAKIADISAALTIEAILGTDRAFDPRVVGLRPHPGQMASARNLMRLLAGSDILSSHRKSDHIVQDAYSIRCAPQVHGAFRDVVRHSVETLEIELASVSDNPVVLTETGDPLRRELPRPAGGARLRLTGRCDRGARFDLRAQAVPAPRPEHLERSSGVPCRRGGRQLGVHGVSVHRRVTGIGDEEPGAPGGRRLDHVLRRPGGPRQHGNHRCPPCPGMPLRCRGGDSDGSARGRPGLRPAGALARRAGQPGGGCLAAPDRATLAHDRALKPDVDATIALVRSGELVEAVESQIGPLE